MRRFFRITAGVVALVLGGGYVFVIYALGSLGCGHAMASACGLYLEDFTDSDVLPATILIGLITAGLLAFAVFGGRKGQADAVD